MHFCGILELVAGTSMQLNEWIKNTGCLKTRRLRNEGAAQLASWWLKDRKEDRRKLDEGTIAERDFLPREKVYFNYIF